MAKLKVDASEADLLLALDKETGGKMAQAWKGNGIPSVTKLSVISTKTEIGEDAKPHSFIKFKNLGVEGQPEEEREIPVWLLQKMKKGEIDKPGNVLAVGYYGKVISEKDKKPVHDFRVIVLATK